jgi:hypothetical protein
MVALSDAQATEKLRRQYCENCAAVRCTAGLDLPRRRSHGCTDTVYRHLIRLWMSAHAQYERRHWGSVLQTHGLVRTGHTPPCRCVGGKAEIAQSPRSCSQTSMQCEESLRTRHTSRVNLLGDRWPGAPALVGAISPGRYRGQLVACRSLLRCQFETIPGSSLWLIAPVRRPESSCVRGAGTS